jgi:hypothetical protein
LTQNKIELLSYNEPSANPDYPTPKNQTATMVTMLGWTLATIADHIGLDVKQGERAIADRLKSERNHGAIMKNPNAKDGER